MNLGTWLLLASLLISLPGRAEDAVELTIPIREIPMSELAEDPVPEQLVILGQGIQNRKSKEAIVLACVGAIDAPCRRLRVVLFDQNRRASWYGGAIEISEPQNFKKKLRRAYKEKYRIDFGRFDYMEIEHDPDRARTINQIFYLTFLIAGPILASGLVVKLAAFEVAKIMLGTGAAIMLSHYLYVGGVDALAFLGNAGLFTTELLTNVITSPIRGIGNAFFVDGNYKTHSMTAQGGWNWTQNPNVVSRKKFKRIKSVLAGFSGAKEPVIAPPVVQSPVVVNTQPVVPEEERCIPIAAPGTLQYLAQGGVTRITSWKFQMKDDKLLHYWVQTEGPGDRHHWVYVERGSCRDMGAIYFREAGELNFKEASAKEAACQQKIATDLGRKHSHKLRQPAIYTVEKVVPVSSDGTSAKARVHLFAPYGDSYRFDVQYLIEGCQVLSSEQVFKP